MLVGSWSNRGEQIRDSDDAAIDPERVQYGEAIRARNLGYCFDVSARALPDKVCSAAPQ
jgi:hypothetical protein